ncbi:MAG: histidine phosphatase family protein [Blastocatellia bacterium]|nr:histidine phosphatase family protein [Blastocatellia bacterium]
MGFLVLVRHGQARTFEKESDQLTPLGEEQAETLGRFWLRQGAAFDEVYSGTLVRQRRTAELAGSAYAAGGGTWPALQTTPALNEYDSVGILERLLPALAEEDASFRALVAAFEARREAPDRNRHFQKMFEALTDAWVRGRLQVDGVEPWTTFRDRVRGFLQEIFMRESGGRRIAVFTSGGVIGLTVQTVLDAPERQALEINWRVRNASLTEFVFGRGRVSFDAFNAIPHLDEERLRTFR